MMNSGVIWKTSNGTDWILLRAFNRPIGALTLHGDSLYCLGDSLFRYIIPQDKWENVCKPFPLTVSPRDVGEMIFLKK